MESQIENDYACLVWFQFQWGKSFSVHYKIMDALNPYSWYWKGKGGRNVFSSDDNSSSSPLVFLITSHLTCSGQKSRKRSEFDQKFINSTNRVHEPAREFVVRRRWIVHIYPDSDVHHPSISQLKLTESRHSLVEHNSLEMNKGELNKPLLLPMNSSGI